MLFARPLLISLSIAGLFPAALSFPAANTVALDVRIDTAPVIAAAQAVIANTTDLVGALANLNQVNTTATQPAIDKSKTWLNAGLFPPNGVLTGTSGDVFTACLRGQQLDDSDIGKYRTRNIELLKLFRDASNEMATELEGALRDVLNKLGKVPNPFLSVAAESIVCGGCGASQRVIAVLQPALTKLFEKINAL
ncbi:hypothetical protein MSAN_01311600 [Mycena sanguinolenta]|uniref:Uncharacterized protein n=1 Tax=Mycena sanguinolenta TaxID=230812 RepID=A0A8H6YF68_9AGAR|nr:hypothetical protein MSAN_01311600 [Mycena sanguinolenta]